MSEVDFGNPGTPGLLGQFEAATRAQVPKSRIVLHWILVLVVGVAFSLLGVPSTPAAAAPAWTGTWSVSPQGGSTTFRQQTLRQIAHTSISGTAARVQLSNAYSSQPLTVSNVHVARRTSGSSIDTATDRVVTFAGSGSVTIPAGGTAISDSVAFAVPALSDVAISLYLPQQTGGLTWHQSGNQTNYIASGDVSANASLPGAQTTGSYYIVSNLDAQNTVSAGAIVTLGASITDGIASSGNSNRRWPNDLAVRLNNAGLTAGVLNQGISGNKLLSDGAGQSALNRFTRDVLNQPGARWVIFADDPINDLGSGNPPSGTQLIDGLKQLISRAHQAGISFLCSTLTPYQGSGGWTSAGETARAAFNSFARSGSSGCDAIVDQDNATHDPNNPTRFLPAYDSGDHLHPNEAGLQAIANAVNLNIFGTPQSHAISLRSRANGKYVTAGSSPLIANATTITVAQQFDQLDAGGGNIALRARANNQLVCAENAGVASLIANRAAIGPWESFQLINNADGTVTLRAVINSKYVTAENAGAAPLIANRTAIGTWEKFDLITS